MGKQAIDGDNNQTGQMLAALMNYPQATFASELKIEGEKAVVTREVMVVSNYFYQFTCSSYI